MKIKRGATVATLTLALAGLTGCGSTGEGTAGNSPSPDTVTSMSAEPQANSSKPAPSPTAAMGGSEEPAGKLVITVKNFKFDGPESVPPGATVTVVNKDSAPHTVTSEEEGVFDVQFEGGETVTFTAPEKPGKYPYLCSIHPAMTATLVVK